MSVHLLVPAALAVTAAPPWWVHVVTALTPIVVAITVAVTLWPRPGRTTRTRRGRALRAVAALSVATLTGTGAGWATTHLLTAATTPPGAVAVTPDGTWHTPGRP